MSRLRSDTRRPRSPRRRHLVATAAVILAAVLAVGAPASLRAQEPAQEMPPDHAHHGGHGVGNGAADPHAHHKAMMAEGKDHAAEEQSLGATTIPDVEVKTADGSTVHFYRDLVQGRAVAMNFIFTTCTTICPPMGANFGQLQKLLGDRVGGDVRLISVSVDPVTDTPARMKEWGAKFGAGEGWTLVTGDRDEVTHLLKALGVFTPDVSDHSPVVLVGDDRRGEWTRAYGLTPPAKLVEIIDRVEGHGEPAAGGG